MTVLLGLGIAGVVLLVLSLIFDGILEGLLGDALGGLLNGFFDGLLSLPVIAGFLSMLGFGGAIVLGTTGVGTPVAVTAGAAAGVVAAWLTWKFSQALMRIRPPPPRAATTSSAPRAPSSRRSRPTATARCCCDSRARP